MRLIVCGDRDWTDREMIRRKLAALKSMRGPDITVIHGDCRGVDRIADGIAQDLGFAREKFPADWSNYGRSAGPIRNRQMLARRPEMVWAFHDNLSASKGTKDMVKAAREAGVRIVHFTHAIEAPNV